MCHPIALCVIPGLTRDPVTFKQYSMLYKNYYVYILANKRNGALYIGVTNSLERRMYEHKNGIFKGFSKTYDCKKLVYYDYYNDITFAGTSHL